VDEPLGSDLVRLGGVREVVVESRRGAVLVGLGQGPDAVAPAQPVLPVETGQDVSGIRDHDGPVSNRNPSASIRFATPPTRSFRSVTSTSAPRSAR
jgi:hypothetical protein